MYINFNTEILILIYSDFIMYNLRIITHIYYKYTNIFKYKYTYILYFRINIEQMELYMI